MMWHTALLACQLGGQRELREECFTVTRQRIIVVTWHGLLHQLRKRLILITHHSFEREFHRCCWRGLLWQWLFWRHLFNHHLCQPQTFARRHLLGNLLVIHTGIQASVLAAEQAIFW